MGWCMKLCNCVSSEIEYYMLKCNFTEEEEKIFLMLSKGKTATEISEKLSLSESTVNRRIKNIMSKVNEVITMKENGVPIWEKVMLTVEEASQYSNIGVNKISSLLNEPGCSFLFCVGKGKRLVKRKEFEKFIEKTLEV
nr:MAG TPA: excisionase [Bacteriophage sp.]